jgi:Ca2+-binding RTX toxin-like protein
MRGGLRLRLGGSIAVSAGLALMLCGGTAAAAVSADPAVTILYVKGDAEANQIQVDCSTGIVLVNGAPAADGHASCADLKKLEVFGFAGDDTISLTGFPKHPPHEEGDFFGEYGSEDEVEIAAYGGDGNDDVAGDAIQTLNGGAGDDRVRAVNSTTTEYLGGPGDDTLEGGALIELMLGGKGNDHLKPAGIFSFAIGQDGADLVSGSPGPDLAIGGNGRDTLVGNGGPDLLVGGVGRDSLFGGASRDLLVGGRGRDTLRGGPGGDREFESSVPPKVTNRSLRTIGERTGEATVVERLANKLLRR